MQADERGEGWVAVLAKRATEEVIISSTAYREDRMKRKQGAGFGDGE
jgi:hypothetical protein